MTRETKVGLLVGFAVILLIGVLVSEFMVDVKEPAGQMTQFAPQTNQSIAPYARDTQTGGDASVIDVQQPQDVEPPVIALPGERLDDREPVAVEPLPHSALAIRQSTRGQSPPITYAPVPPRHESVDDIIRSIDRQESNDLSSSPRTGTRGATPFGRQNNTVVNVEPENDPDHRTREQRRNNETVVIDDRLLDVEEGSADTRVLHKVVSGETLYHIAKKYYGDGEKWRLISEANPRVVDSRGRIRKGDNLVIPGLVRETPRNTRANANNRDNNTRQPREITVKEGESLSTIARKHLGDDSRWVDLLEANKDRLSDPDHVVAGMKLRLPTEPSQNVAEAPLERRITERDITTRENDATRSNNERSTREEQTTRREPKTYTVKSGDTLSSIARKTLGHDRHYIALFEANQDKLASMNDIQVGQTLTIPDID